MLETPIVPADAVGVLSGQLRLHLRRLARLIEPQAAALDLGFAGRLEKKGFGPDPIRTLSRITVGAAARALSNGRPTAGFLEMLDYSGRRLARLNVAPARIIGALREYDRLLEARLAPHLSAAAPESANLKWAREQVHFCIALSLNNSFYQVREAETRAFYDLSDAELRSRSAEELLNACLRILKEFSRADAGRLAAPEAIPPELLGKLSKPVCILAGGAADRLILDTRLRAKYPCVWSIPLAANGRLAAILQLGFTKNYRWLPRELELLNAAGERCGLAAEKARLMEDLAHREEQIRQLAGHMLQVEEEERRRISRELHDETGQSMLCIRLQLEMIEKAMPAGLEPLTARLREVRELTENAILETRRIISALSPAVLEQLGLAAALRQFASRFRRSWPVRVELVLPDRKARLPREAEIVVYRLVQEACHNVAKHSRASTVKISVRSTDQEVRLRVEDNGIGFDADRMLDPAEAGTRNSFGLAGMKERVALLGGRFRIDSRSNHGTKIAIELPLSTARTGPKHREPQDRNTCQKFEYC